MITERNTKKGEQSFDVKQEQYLRAKCGLEESDMAFTKFKLMIGAFGAVCIAANGLHEPVEIQVTLPPPAAVVDTAAKTVSYISDKLSDAAESPQAAFEETALHSDPQTVYRIRNADNEPTSQIGAYYDLDLAKSVCPKTHCIFDSNGVLIYAGG